MLKSINKETVSRRELRQFGLGLGLMFGLIGSALLWKDRNSGFPVVLIGFLLTLLFWITAPGVRTFYAGWMNVAGVMAKIMTMVLLTVLYVLLLTPIAVLGRVFGRRFFEREFREEKNSYWVARDTAATGQNYEKQW